MSELKQSERETASARGALVGAAVVALLTLGVVIQPSPENAPAVVGMESESIGVDVSQSDPERSLVAMRLARARFYDESVAPLVHRIDLDNRAAAVRCIERLDQLMNVYHTGVDKFVTDMTSISTRLGILKRMPGGWWSSDGRVDAFVQEKFESHLFSEQRLVDDVSAVLLQFRADIDANQRRLLVGVRAALTLSDLPDVELASQEEFFHQLSVQLNEYATRQGMTSVENMVGALVLGEVGAFAARSVISGLLARFAPSVAISTAAGASATVGASATGAGGGSLGGPVGTVVGFGAGLAVGLIIDWWMTERFEAELSGQMHTYLDDLRTTLVSGGGQVSPTEEPAIGLEVALPRLCDQLTQAYRDRFFEQIVDGESS